MSNKKFAVISGATAGIGSATAMALAQIGYDVILLGRRQDRLSEMAKEIQKTNPSRDVIIEKLDIQDRRAVEKFIEKHRASLQNLEILVNSAGLAKGVAKFQDADLSDIDIMMNTNVMGLMYLTRLLLPFMIKNQKGHVVNLGSVAGRWVYPGGAIYCASKFAVRALSEGLRMDLLGTPVRVSNIEPGMVNTEFSKVRFDGDQDKADKVYAGMNPLTADDIAETIRWIVLRPSHVNIQELVIYPTDQAHLGMVHRR